MGTALSGAPAEQVRAAIERLPALVNEDAALARRCRGMHLDLMLASGDERFYVPIRDGRLEPVAPGSQILRSATLVFTAAPDAWLAHWRPVPAPGEHDLLALAKDERLTVEGDMTMFMRHLQNLKDILAAPRALFREN